MIDLDALAAKLKLHTDIDVRESRNWHQGSTDYLYLRIANGESIFPAKVYADGTFKLMGGPFRIDRDSLGLLGMVLTLIADCEESR